MAPRISVLARKHTLNGPGRCSGRMNRVRGPEPSHFCFLLLSRWKCVQSCVLVNKESMLSAHILCRTGAAKTKLSCQMIVSLCVNQVEAFHIKPSIYILFSFYSQLFFTRVCGNSFIGDTGTMQLERITQINTAQVLTSI